MIEVMIVDDHAVMRELLRQVLEGYSDIADVAEAADGEDAVRQATRFRPAVALIDIHLPTMNGIQASMLIKLQSPNTAIIGLTAGEPDHKDRAMISAGAQAVINKADVIHSLYPSIVEAVKGLKAVI